MSIEVDFSIAPVRRPSPQDAPESAHAFYCLGSGFRLHVPESTLSSIRRQCSQNPTEEAGGVLLGRHLETEDGYVVIVDDHLPVPSENKSEIHFSFDQPSIQAILARVSRSTDYVVGWYHSHIAGTPFMSNQDHRLHRDHFPLPWYVSCVVGVGEWGMPVDFWRLSDGELIGLDEYSLDVKPGASATATQQRYLRACLSDEAAEPASAEYTAALLPDLGINADGPLGLALRRIQLSSGMSATRLDELRLVVDLATALAADSAVADDIGELREKLAAVRSLNGALSFIAVSDRFRTDMSFCGSKAFFLVQGASSITWFDAILNTLWPVDLNVPVFAGCFSADGSAWLLTDRNQVIRLAPVPGSSLGEIPRFDRGVLTIGGLAGAPQQVIAHDDDLWIVTSEHWYRIPVGSDEERVRLGSKWDLPEEDVCLLVSGLGGTSRSGGSLITQTGDLLRRWNPDGADIQQVTEEPLPPPWRDWRLDQACMSGNGLCLLFDDGGTGQIGLFDGETLKLRWHYLRESKRGTDQATAAICADPLGRIYLRDAGIIYRFRP